MTKKRSSHLQVVQPRGEEDAAPAVVAELPAYSIDTLLREKKKRDDFAARQAKKSLADAQSKMAKANETLRKAQANWKPMHARGCKGMDCWCKPRVEEETKKR